MRLAPRCWHSTIINSGVPSYAFVVIIKLVVRPLLSCIIIYVFELQHIFYLILYPPIRSHTTCRGWPLFGSLILMYNYKRFWLFANFFFLSYIKQSLTCWRIFNVRVKCLLQCAFWTSLPIAGACDNILLRQNKCYFYLKKP